MLSASLVSNPVIHSTIPSPSLLSPDSWMQSPCSGVPQSEVICLQIVSL